MKKIIAISLAVVLLLTVVAVPVMAAKKDNPANDIMQTLYLYEKDANWDIVWDGAWGKMSFKLSIEGDTATFDCVFNGHGLDAGTEYSLIYYPETQTTWPWAVTVIDNGTANGGGNINLAGTFTMDSANTAAYPVKVWLVLSEDITNDRLTGWNPSEYLFEHNLIPNPNI